MNDGVIQLIAAFGVIAFILFAALATAIIIVIKWIKKNSKK